MKLIDEKGKLFGKINVIDCCVLLLIIALGIGAYVKFGMEKTSNSAAMQPISYSVKIEKVRKVALNNVQIGDTLFDKTSGNAIGTIVAVDSEQATERIKMPNGTIVRGNVENRINLILTVEAEGVVNDSGWFVNKTYELLVGSKKKFITKYFECEGSVNEIF
ncbi:MAG: DUF4330 domain-containing protein [Lachnospiraceae bacterium]|nr:DUF4330 domain-containing protein [Lachnospiraceae bacterium]